MLDHNLLGRIETLRVDLDLYLLVWKTNWKKKTFLFFLSQNTNRI